MIIIMSKVQPKTPSGGDVNRPEALGIEGGEAPSLGVETSRVNLCFAG